jgi:hypothetical protein
MHPPLSLPAEIDRHVPAWDAGHFYPLAEPLTHTSFDGDSFSDVSTPTKIARDSWSSPIPADAKAILLRIRAKDSAAWGTAGLYFLAGPSSTHTNAIGAKPAGGDVEISNSGPCPCDHGDIYYIINASGTNTMDITLTVWGYWI